MIHQHVKSGYFFSNGGDLRQDGCGVAPLDGSGNCKSAEGEGEDGFEEHFGGDGTVQWERATRSD